MHAYGNGNTLASQGHMNGLSLGYAASDFKLRLAYTSQTDAIKESVDSSVASNVAATAYNTKGWLIAGSYDINQVWTIKAGNSHYQLSRPSDNLSAASIPSVNGFVLDPANFKNYQGSDIAANLAWLGLNYKPTKALGIYGGYYRANYNPYNSGSTWSGSAANLATVAGQINWTSLLIDYNIDETKDSYLALANIALNSTANTAITGAVKNSAASAYSPIASNRLIAVGLRYKF